MANQSIPHRILCAENNDDICTMLTTYLSKRNYSVTVAKTIEELVYEAQHNSRYELYLLNAFYPDGTGVEACQSLRRFDTDTPIIFYSADAREFKKQEALEAGAQEYIIKPGNLDQLFLAINTYIKPPDRAINSKELEPPPWGETKL